MTKLNAVDGLPDSEIWEASGGVRIPLKDMGAAHLRNATNYMRKSIMEGVGEDETLMEDMAEKLVKLEGETTRRLNTKPPAPKSLPMTEARRQAGEAYRKMIDTDRMRR